MIAFAMCISNFVVPLILGRGVVLFTTNLMYVRFSDVANYPSGAAIGIIMFVARRACGLRDDGARAPARCRRRRAP